VGPDRIILPNVPGANFDRTPEPMRTMRFNTKKYQMLDQLLAPMRKMEIDMTEFSPFNSILFLKTCEREKSGKLLCDISEMFAENLGELVMHPVHLGSAYFNVHYLGQCSKEKIAK
ncbi:hypothetical protein PMAYCL1PPCAC_14202, partial [Pristionchus mayeri]